MRHSRPGRPYYNIDRDYIEAMLHGYFRDENDDEEDCDIYGLLDDTESESEDAEVVTAVIEVSSRSFL